MSDLRDALAKVIDRELQTRGCDIDGLAFIGFASDARAFLARFGEELLRAEGDAGRWRALISSARIRPLGCAGITIPTENHMAHLGLELWTLYPQDGINATENARGVEWLTKYADIAALRAGDGGR